LLSWDGENTVKIKPALQKESGKDSIWNMSDTYKMHEQVQETAIVVKEETPLTIKYCDPVSCGRDCENGKFLRSYDMVGLPTPKVPCIPSKKEIE